MSNLEAWLRTLFSPYRLTWLRFIGAKNISLWLLLLLSFLIAGPAHSMSITTNPVRDNSEKSADDTPPNIVLFVADDLGAHDIEPYGNRIVRTPNLKRLAEQGMRFTRAFVASPTCSPSRAALHTGMMPFRNGAHANHTGIKEGVRTLPAYLRELGYRTALAGKYHIGPMQAYPFELIGGTNVPEPGHEGDGALWTDLNLEPVEQWLREAAGEEQPFLLVVNDHSPHVIWPEEAIYNPKKMDVPSRHIDTPEYRAMRARYYTDVTKMDRNVGCLLESLDKHGFAENTLFVFISDHGPQFPFGKWGLYDYGVQTPLLVQWPGQVEPDSDTDAMVSLVDLLPTFIEVAGGNAPENLDGRSFLPVLFGEADAHRKVVFATHTGDGNMNRTPMRMIRTGRYKYILNLAPHIQYTTHMDRGARTPYWKSWEQQSFETEHAASVLYRYHNRPAEELYDLQTDPYEIRNLAADPAYTPLVEDFRRQLSEWRRRQGDTETGPYTPPKHNPSNKPVTPYIFK